MTEEKKTETETMATSEERRFPVGELDDFMKRMSTSMGDAPAGSAPSMNLRKATVTIEAEMCRPDTFTRAIRVGIRELDADTELTVLRDLEGANDKAMAIELGKAAMYAVNGRTLASHEKDVVWQALGFGGRLCVGNAFMSHCAGLDPDILGKSLGSVEIE